jgi:hypothetical protein
VLESADAAALWSCTLLHTLSGLSPLSIYIFLLEQPTQKCCHGDSAAAAAAAAAADNDNAMCCLR